MKQSPGINLQGMFTLSKLKITDFGGIHMLCDAQGGVKGGDGGGGGCWVLEEPYRLL